MKSYYFPIIFLLLIFILTAGCSGGKEKVLLDSISIMERQLDSIQAEYTQLTAAQNAKRAYNDSIEKLKMEKENAERAGYDSLIARCEAEANKFVEYTRKMEQTEEWDYCELIGEAYTNYESLHSKIMKVIDKMSPEQIARVRRIEKRVDETPILCWG